MGKSNYYDKMEWQDSIKVIITQKLHQIRNWEFHNMLYGMSTIEIIENLIIENLTENRVIRRFGWPPTMWSPFFDQMSGTWSNFQLKVAIAKRRKRFWDSRVMWELGSIGRRGSINSMHVMPWSRLLWATHSHTYALLIKDGFMQRCDHGITYNAIYGPRLPTERISPMYGSEFWTMYNWPFSDLEHFYYTWFAPSYSETISLGVIVKSAIRAFRKHIYTLYTFTRFCTSHGSPNAKKWPKSDVFTIFFHLFGTIL